MNRSELRERLTERAGAAAVPISPELTDRLLVYYELLTTWNRRINLTGLDLDDAGPAVLDRLLVEPVAAAAHVPPVGCIIDIGSGGGSPAIPLAAALPGVRLRMVESKTRKSVFLREAAREVGIDADVLTGRYEALHGRTDLREGHDALTVRAVRVNAVDLAALALFVRPGGRLLLFRGASEAAPSCLLPGTLSLLGSYPLVPGLGSRVVVFSRIR